MPSVSSEYGYDHLWVHETLFSAPDHFFKKKQNPLLGDGEIAPWLRALAAIPEA